MKDMIKFIIMMFMLFFSTGIFAQDIKIISSCNVRQDLTTNYSNILLKLNENEHVDFIEFSEYPYIKIKKDDIIGYISISFIENPNIHPQYEEELKKQQLRQQNLKTQERQKEKTPDSYNKYIIGNDVYEVKTWIQGNSYTQKTYKNGNLESLLTGYY
jgi:hypothetical protein